MKLSELELYYIERSLEEKTVEEIAQFLGRTVSTVKKHIKDNNWKPKTQTHKLYGQRAGATVMTEAASEAVDEQRNKSKKKPVKVRDKTNHIHTIFGD